MRLSRKSLHKAVTGVALGAGLVTAGAKAAIVYDVRFSDGTHSKQAAVGNYTIDLWVQVSGTDGNNHNEGFAFTYANVASSQSGGAVTGATLNPNGSVVGSPLVTPWDGAAVSKNGGSTIITADGLGDWGSTSSQITNANYMLARTAAGGEQGFATGQGQQSTNTAYGQGDVNTWEEKVASWVINVTSVDTSQTGQTLWGAPKVPATKNGVGTGNAITFQVDGLAEGSATSTALDSQSVGSAYMAPGHFIAFTNVATVVPEPASLGLLGVGALGLLARRRQTK